MIDEHTSERAGALKLLHELRRERPSARVRGFMSRGGGARIERLAVAALGRGDIDYTLAMRILQSVWAWRSRDRAKRARS
jgi:hypothetical protein